MDESLDLQNILGILRDQIGLASSGDGLEDAITLAAAMGLDRDMLRAELADVVRERLLLWLVGDVRNDLNFVERRQAVIRRLQAISGSSGFQENDRVVSRLAELQAAVAVASRKPIRRSLSQIDEVSCGDVLKRQQYRCAVCGVPLREHAVRSSIRFKNGYEPIVSPHLEHRIPYYLVGNITAYEVLCAYCNQTKHDRLGLHEDGFVLAGNFLRRHESERVRHRVGFWCLWTARKCADAGCIARPANSILFVERVSPASPFSIDNVRSVCADHARDDAWWIHADKV